MIIVRLWAEESSESGFRLRVVGSTGGRDPAMLAVTDSIDTACEVVRRWLVDQVTIHTPPDG